MKNFVIALLLCGFLLPSWSFANDNIKEMTLSITGPDGSPQHTIKVTYPFYNQARLSGITFKFDDADPENPVLKISGQIDNMLRRDLVNAVVAIECFDKDGESLNADEKSVIPRSIKREKQPGRFHIKTEYSKDIASCSFNIHWPGKPD